MNLTSKRLRLVCLVVGLGGFVLVAGATPGTGTTKWPVDLVAPGAVLVAAALAALVALRGVQTWSEKQAEHAATATRDNRSRVYEQVLAHIIKSFTGGAPMDQEPVVRAMAASWASKETMQALSEWFRSAARHSGQPLNKTHAFELIYRVAAATRTDIDPGGGPSKDDVLRMIFNDYDPAEHNPKGISAMRVGLAGQVLEP